MQHSNDHDYKDDPYRAVRKPPSPDEYSDPSRALYESEQFHSRSPSESSTSRLATSVNNKNSGREVHNDYDYYNQQDPYAPRQTGNKKKKKHQNRQSRQSHYRENDIPEKRANSYLPYSNHRRDPYDPIEPIYLEDEHLPSFNSPGSRGPIGSILQDNIVMDMMEQDAPAPHKGQITPITNALPPPKKQRKFNCLGIAGKKIVLIVFLFIAIVAVIWYFVWPRTPTLLFSNADFPTGESSSSNSGSSSSQNYYYANWNVNFTADNTANWIPTSIAYYEAKVIDKNTGVSIGYGKTDSFKISAKTTTQIVTIPVTVNYTMAGTSDTTWTDLYYACIVTNSDPGTVQALNIIFELTCHIAGLVWTQTSTAGPTTGLFQCPLS